MTAPGGAGRDKSDGLSRAEIRCGFHAIQAEAKRKQEAAVRRKQKEAVKRAVREDEARIAEAKRYHDIGVFETILLNLLHHVIVLVVLWVKARCRVILE